MKHLKLTSRTLLGLALMGALAAAPLTTAVAQAAPGHDEVRRDERDDNDQGRPRGRRDFGGRRNDRRGNADRRDNRDGDDRDGDNRASRFDDRSAVAPKFVGVVTKVKSDREFDIRMDDKIYNVYLDAPTGRVSDGQTVQLDGERIGKNDIRSASLLLPARRR